MKKLAFVVLTIVCTVLPASPASAADKLLNPRTTPAGTYGGIEYIQYDGVFVGRTSSGAYRVPYRITAPADPGEANRTVVVEPPHFVAGLDGLDLYFGRDYLLGRGFVHAGVGYSTAVPFEGAEFRILDPTVPGVFVHGGFDDAGGRTDYEIIVDFAAALADDSQAGGVLGEVERRYLTGYSDSSAPVLSLVTSGQADGVFDLAFPFTTEWTDPQIDLVGGDFNEGKLVIVNSEGEGASSALVDRGIVPRRYRHYAVAGSPHVPDPLGPPFFSNRTTPASFAPALRAHFLQSHHWVVAGTEPPPSTHLLASDDETLERDANGNAIAVDAAGSHVPRLPFVELGEARFVAGFVGTYDHVKGIEELGLAPHAKYLDAFGEKLVDYLKAGYILKDDADLMRRRAALCPPLTYTETYDRHYDNFVAVAPC